MSYYSDLENAFTAARTELSKVDSFKADNHHIIKLFRVLNSLVVPNPHAIACDETCLRVAFYALLLKTNAGGGPRLKQMLTNLMAPWILPLDPDDVDFLEQFDTPIVFPNTRSPRLTSTDELVDGFALDFPKLPLDDRPTPSFSIPNAQYGPYSSFQYLASQALATYNELSNGPGITLDDTKRFVPFLIALTNFLADNPNILHTDLYSCRAAIFATVLFLGHLNHDEHAEMASYFCLPVATPSIDILDLAAPHLNTYPTTWQRIEEPTSSGFAIEFPVAKNPITPFAAPFRPPPPVYTNTPPPHVSLTDASQSILHMLPIPPRSYYRSFIKHMPTYRQFLDKKLDVTDPGLLDLCTLLERFVDRNPYAISRDPFMVKTAIFCQRLIHNAEGTDSDIEALNFAAGSWAVPVDLTSPEISSFDGDIDYPHVLYPTFVDPNDLVGNYALAFPRLESANDPAVDEHHHPTTYDWVMHLAADLAFQFHKNKIDDKTPLRADNPALHRLLLELAHFLSVRPHMVAYDVNICRLALTCASLFPRITDHTLYDNCARVWRFPLDVSNPDLWDPPLSMDFFRGSANRLKPETILPVDPTYPYATPTQLPFLDDETVNAGPFAPPPFLGNPDLEFACTYSYDVLALPQRFIAKINERLTNDNAAKQKAKGKAKVTSSIDNFPRLHLLPAQGKMRASNSPTSNVTIIRRLASSGDESPSAEEESSSSGDSDEDDDADHATSGTKRKAVHSPSPKRDAKNLRKTTTAQRKNVVKNPVPAPRRGARRGSTVPHGKGKTNPEATIEDTAKTPKKTKTPAQTRLKEMPTRPIIDKHPVLTADEKKASDAYAARNDFSSFTRTNKVIGHLTAADLKRPGTIDVSTMCTRCIGHSKKGYSPCIYRGPGLKCSQCKIVNAKQCSYEYTGDRLELVINKQLKPYIKASIANFIEQVNQARMFDRLRIAQAAAYNDTLRSADLAWLRVGELAKHFYESFFPDVYAKLFDSEQTLFELLALDPEELIARIMESFTKLDVSQLLGLPALQSDDPSDFQQGSSRDHQTDRDDEEEDAQHD